MNPQGTGLAHTNGGKYQTGDVEAETTGKPWKSHKPPTRVRQLTAPGIANTNQAA